MARKATQYRAGRKAMVLPPRTGQQPVDSTAQWLVDAFNTFKSEVGIYLTPASDVQAVLASVDAGETLVVTAYEPDPARWSPDLRRRKPS